MTVALTNALADKEQECRQVAMLRAECKTLRTDLEQKETQLKDSMHERAVVAEKLGTAGVNAEQSQQQIVALKAQVRLCVCVPVCFCLCARKFVWLQASELNGFVPASRTGHVLES